MDDSDKYFGNQNYGVVIPFLLQQRPDWEGRWLHDIRAWSHEQLEEDHHYIQWLFPLLTESQAVIAPRIRDFELELFSEDERIENALIESVEQMLDFFGFALSTRPNEIILQPAANRQERMKEWLTPDNHNFLRLSRMLSSLTLAKLDRYAIPILHALEGVYETEQGQAAISQMTLWHWRRAVRQTIPQSSRRA